MSEKVKSFEEFYSKSKDNIFNIDIVANYAEIHDGDIGEFHGDMFCPECQQAELSFVHKTSKRRAHLRKIASSNHANGCSYCYEYASKKTIKKYVDSLDYGAIQDKLNSIMNMLCRKPKMKKTNTDGAEETNKRENSMLISEQKGKETILRALRRKRLNGWIDESDGTDLYVFYGKVKLEVVEKEKNSDNPENCYKYYLLKIYTQNNKGEWKSRTSLYRGDINDLVKKETVYYIVMIGYLDFQYKPFTIKLVNKNAIKYRET
ncbi:MAG: hypothetical protein NC313_10980 [Butyrivibrio sp.]|nr:hypothetical protein [Butyrivibrio sp.]